MRGAGVMTILLIVLVACKRKSKKIKNKNQKMRTKEYKKPFLYTGCTITGVSPSEEQDGTINVPITIGFEPNIN